jgi:hypothetical protein
MGVTSLTEEQKKHKIRVGKELIAERLKQQNERVEALKAAKDHYTRETAKWRRLDKMGEELKKAAETAELLKYGDALKPSETPAVKTGENDKEIDSNIQSISRLTTAVNHFKKQLETARTTEMLKEEQLKTVEASETASMKALFDPPS